MFNRAPGKHFPYSPIRIRPIGPPPRRIRAGYTLSGACPGSCRGLGEDPGTGTVFENGVTLQTDDPSNITGTLQVPSVPSAGNTSSSFNWNSFMNRLLDTGTKFGAAAIQRGGQGGNAARSGGAASANVQGGTNLSPYLPYLLAGGAVLVGASLLGGK